MFGKLVLVCQFWLGCSINSIILCQTYLPLWRRRLSNIFQWFVINELKRNSFVRKSVFGEKNDSNFFADSLSCVCAQTVIILYQDRLESRGHTVNTRRVTKRLIEWRERKKSSDYQKQDLYNTCFMTLANVLICI